MNREHVELRWKTASPSDSGRACEYQPENYPRGVSNKTAHLISVKHASGSVLFRYGYTACKNCNNGLETASTPLAKRRGQDATFLPGAASAA